MSLIPRPAAALLVSLYALVALAPIGAMVRAAGPLPNVWAKASGLWTPQLLAVAGNTLVIALGATAGALALGMLQALLLERLPVTGRTFFRRVYLIPLLVPPYIQTIAWTHLAAPGGPLFPWTAAGEAGSPAAAIYSPAGAVWVMSLAYAPLVTLCVVSGLRTMDGRLEEAARLHRPLVAVLCRITIPAVRPHIVCGAMFVFVFCLLDFGVPDLLRVRVYATEIFIRFSAFYDNAAAAALSLPLLGLTLATLCLARSGMRKRPFVSLFGGFRPAVPPGVSPWARWAGFSFLAALFLLSSAAPLAVFVIRSSEPGVFAAVWRSSADAVAWSFAMALAGGVCLTALSFPLAYLMERTRRWGPWVDVMTLVPFGVPATVIGIGMIHLWNRPQTQWVYGTFGIVLLAYAARFTPFGVRILQAGIKQVDRGMEEAAVTAVKGKARVFFRIAGGMTRPGTWAAFFFGFVLCFRDLDTTLLVLPAGTETLPVKIYNLMHYGADGQVAALSLVTTAVILLFGLACRFGLRERYR